MSPAAIEKIFQVGDAPIDKVSVFQSRAEITRSLTVEFSEAGTYEVKLQGLPASIDTQSLRLEAHGECVVQHCNYSQAFIDPPNIHIDEGSAKAQAAALHGKLASLSTQQAALSAQRSRGQTLQGYLQQYMQTIVAPPSGAADKPAGLAAVQEALSYAREQMAEADAEKAQLELDSKKLDEEIASIRAQLAALNQSTAEIRDAAGPVLTRQAVVSLEVPHEGSVELEVRYVTHGASWASSYDVRIATTQQHAVSCTYYGEVTQTTGEDWNGVSLTLSTAEPAIAGTPPALPPKSLGWKKPPVFYPNEDHSYLGGGAPKAKKKMMMSRKGSAAPGACADECEMMASCSSAAPQMFGSGGGGFGGMPPPPPRAAVATAAVTAASLGAVAYQIAAAASVKCDGSSQKLTVGVLELAAEVTHYVVPSLEAAAYLKAKAVNVTDYLLLASDDVSIFFDNRFVTKTSLRSVSPGESFDVFLGIDPAVKVTYAPPRKASRKRGIFTKSQAVTHSHSTTLTNSKSVPIVVALVDALPRSTEDLIKVSLKQPATASVELLKFGDTDESLVAAALELADVTAAASTAADTAAGTPTAAATGAAAAAAAGTTTGILKVVRSELGKMVWIVRVPPHGEQRLPFEYEVEWPSDKEIVSE